MAANQIPLHTPLGERDSSECTSPHRPLAQLHSDYCPKSRQARRTTLHAGRPSRNRPRQHRAANLRRYLISIQSSYDRMRLLLLVARLLLRISDPAAFVAYTMQRYGTAFIVTVDILFFYLVAGLGHQFVQGVLLLREVLFELLHLSMKLFVLSFERIALAFDCLDVISH